MQPRRARRIDANQRDIVDELISLGISVDLDHDDILVGYKGQTYWFEVKNPNTLLKKGGFKKGTIRKKQTDLKNMWKGQYDIIWTTRQILDIIGHKDDKTLNKINHNLFMGLFTYIVM